jgi:SAM-dependent methyltransferase
METRKEKEAIFHDIVRNKNLEKNSSEFSYLTSNRKFYSIIRQSWNFTENWLDERCQNKKVLDYCCGDGEMTILLAKKGALAYGIDISPVSVENARKKAAGEGLEGKANFSVDDAEKLSFENNFFDIIICHGVLHHLDVKKAFPELARVLKYTGEVICVEPLAYNPIFQFYRKKTPHLRTEWEAEHILTKKDIAVAKNYFGDVKLNFFHLTTLAAVPLRNSKIFKYVLGVFELLDDVLLKIPFLKWWAWQVIFILSKPKK